MEEAGGQWEGNDGLLDQMLEVKMAAKEYSVDFYPR